MASARPAQTSVRSDFVRERMAELTRATGKTATRIMEEALARYPLPPPTIDEEPLPPGLKREGRLLVLTGGPHLTVEEVQASIDEIREGARD